MKATTRTRKGEKSYSRGNSQGRTDKAFQTGNKEDSDRKVAQKIQ